MTFCLENSVSVLSLNRIEKLLHHSFKSQNFFVQTAKLNNRDSSIR